MRYIFIATLFHLCVNFNLLAQKTIGDITLPKKSELDNTLQLNGGGVREKYFIDLYVTGLYLPTINSNASKIIENDESMSIKIFIVSDMITTAKMKEAISEGFEKSTQGKVSTYQIKITEFEKAISENIKKGVRYEIYYSAVKKSTQVYKDGIVKADIPGLDFKKVLFGIWLGADPADKGLKDSMLGK